MKHGFDLIIKNGLIVDGSGGKPYKADIGIVDDLIYAIGEILLVVIGILIALQVNNWNEGTLKL